MAWREHGDRARLAVEHRLDALTATRAVAGRLAPARETLHDGGSAPPLVLGPWSRPATRALAVLVCGLLAVVALLVWRAQPRSVESVPGAAAVPSAVEAPEVLATGPPLDSAGAEVVPTTEVSPAADRPTIEVSPAAEETLVVHVAGLVRQPGLVRLPAGSRVADAIDLAGGVTRRRAADGVNLARVLVDGEQIVVGEPGAGLAAGSTAGLAAGSGSGPATTSGAPPAVVDLNAATLSDLDTLPGVGPVLAGRILAWRTEHGPFRSVAELGEVSGIGDATLERLRPLVRV